MSALHVGAEALKAAGFRQTDFSVHGDDGEWANRAKGILEQTGAESVASAAEKAADYQP